MRVVAECYSDFFRKVWGLMLRRPRPVLLLGVNEVHTLFMRAPIYVVFLKEEARADRAVMGRALGAELAKPWRQSIRNPKADHVLELPADVDPPRGSVEVVCSN